jgi:hypothetical protein
MDLKIISWPVGQKDKIIILCDISPKINLYNLIDDLDLCIYFKNYTPYFNFLKNKYNLSLNNINIEKKFFHYPVVYNFSKNICLVKSKVIYSGIKKNTFCLITSCKNKKKNYELVKECVEYGYEYYLITTKNILEIKTYLIKHKVPSEKIIKIYSDNILDFLTEAVVSIDLITENYSIFIGCDTKKIYSIMLCIKSLRKNNNINIYPRFICV